ncbi:hypothetical protein CC78DRAFT_600383 [Lojkania enalia]|uniref:Rhodopsin domain-containing protein n=1 Tax=Lojkania enalia TaxID=147567 RepID=A0A9P4KAT8_9PLEO|nr:hypothetical protein CC78DRAFT_600383 [Didymosphaeria enalia]
MEILPRTIYKIYNTRQRALVIVPTVFTFFSIVLTCLRIYGRRLKKTKVLIDDYLCILGCILGCVLLASDWAMVVGGNGGNSLKELKDPNDLKFWYKFLTVAYITWIPAIAVVQLAILALYLRLFHVVDWARKACYVMVALVVAWLIASFVADLALCKPIQKLWDPMIPGTCGDHSKACTSIGITHIIFDFTILLLPMPLIWNLKVALYKKFLMSIVLLCGVFATVASILRISCLIKLTTFTDPTDLPAQIWLAYVYHFSEVPVAIVCASVFCIAPVYQRVKASTFGSYARTVFSLVSKSRMASGNDDSGSKESGNGLSKDHIQRIDVIRIDGNSSTNFQPHSGKSESDKIPAGSLDRDY